MFAAAAVQFTTSLLIDACRFAYYSFAYCGCCFAGCCCWLMICYIKVAVLVAALLIADALLITDATLMVTNAAYYFANLLLLC